MNTIRANYIYGFDIYLKLQGKYVLYHAGGENFPQDKIDNLIKNKVGIIYIANKDQVSYHQYITDNLTVIITNKKVPIEERSRIVHFSVRFTCTVKYVVLQIHLKLLRQNAPIGKQLKTLSMVSSF